MSTKTGFAPTNRIEFIVEQKVNGVVMTSSPFLIFKANKDKCKPAVQEFNAKHSLDFLYFLNFFSNNWVTGPLPIHFDLITFNTDSISLAPIAGSPYVI